MLAYLNKQAQIEACFASVAKQNPFLCLLASPFAPFCCPGFYLTKGEIEGSKANKH
jgi:hypothetical protein